MIKPYYLEEEKFVGYGGWFIFYVITLIAGIVAVGNNIYTNLSTIGENGALVTTTIYIVLALGAIFLVLLLGSIMNKSTLTRAFAITVSVYVLCINIIGLIFFDNNHWISILVSTVLAIVWLGYCSKSKRVADTFTENYGNTAKIFLRTLFISLFALLAVIHIILVVLVTGVLPTILTLILPVLSEIFWFIKFWMEQGFLNAYTSILILYVFGIAIPFFVMLFSAPDNK